MTSKIPPTGKLPKSSATYEEYEWFLAGYYMTYSHFERSKDEGQSNAFQKMMVILDSLAENSRVRPPKAVVLEEDKVASKYASSEDAANDILKFYQHFRTSYWNRKDDLSAMELYALLESPAMKF